MVDVNGVQVDLPYVDFEDQADMCELVRTLLVARKFENYNINMKQLTFEFIDSINCYGDDGQTKVCAATDSAFPERNKWLVLF